MTALDSDAELCDRVTDALDAEPTVVRELDGGMIGTVREIRFADREPVVAKTGDTPLSVEAFMLRALRERSELPVPTVYHATDDLLVIEYISGDSSITPAVERDAAERLAALHERSADAYGFERDTLTGPLRQPNPWTDSWIEFYRDQRVLHAAEGARDAGALPAEHHERIRTVAAEFETLLREPDSPSLIHGDVWTTNVLATDERVTAFLDPATYYASPEIELAYILWTETFGEPFFDRYAELRGIEDGFFEQRADVYALYPLLVHVRLFGDEFVAELDRTLTTLGY